MIARARQKAARDGLNIMFHQGYGQQLPIEDAAVDAVTISLALHHVAEAQVPDVLSEMLRVLRPGGVLLVVEFIPVGPLARLLTHGNDDPIATYGAQMAQVGFEDLQAGRITKRAVGFLSGRAPAAG